MLEQFAHSKKRLLAFVDELNRVDFVDRDILENSRLIDEVTRLEKGDFKISLVAPFSAGKSTFINAIVGKDLLSMDIRAETSVITKIRYSEDIKLEVNYHDNRESEVIDKDSMGNSLTYNTCKEILKQITTVRDEKNEIEINEVIVYCPLDICKDNVELIDTPGLFSRHEKHESITNNILSKVNAVIFMIDPDSVGEEHFTEKIQNYVGSAKNSNLEEDGRHIFFVINKIDIFDPEDIQKAKGELKEVLKNILLAPQIHEVSAYFGMVGKQLLCGDIDIKEVQKDRKIKIPDPLEPEYTISGRSINYENTHDIIDFSKIKDLEISLGEYLQSKNDYLIKDLKTSIEQILSDTMNRMKYQIGQINHSLQHDSTEYLSKVDNVKSEITALKEVTVRNINRKIDQKIFGGISGGSIDDTIKEEVRKELTDITKDLDRFIFTKWTKVKRDINRDNAEHIVQDLIFEVEQNLIIKTKEMSKNCFLLVKSIINSLIEETQEEFEKVTEKIQESEVKNLGKKMDKIGNLNVDSLVGNITNKIEKEFSSIVVSISKSFKSKIDGAVYDSTKTVKKEGLINWFKSWFGKEEYVNKFDIYEFRRRLDNLMDDLKDEITSALIQNEQAVRVPILDTTNTIVNDLKTEIVGMVNSVITIKQKILNETKLEMSKNKEEKNKLIYDKEQKSLKAEELFNRFQKSLSEKEEIRCEIADESVA